jgi:hypothetical protein
MHRELFNPMDKDNKDSTPLLENLTAIAAQAWIDELLDPKKATFQYLSESGSDYCWSHCSDEVKTALMGKMAVNDRAESSFAGITAQIQDYGRIGYANGAAISDMGRNGFLDLPLTKTDLKGQKRGMFYSLSKELQLTAVVAAMECTNNSKIK